MRAGPGLPKSAIEGTKPRKTQKRLRVGKPPPEKGNQCPESLIIEDGWVPGYQEPLRWEAECQLEKGHTGYHKYGKLRWRVDRISSYIDLVVQDVTGIRSAGDTHSQLGLVSRVSQALTERELEILRMMCRGLLNKEIAAALEISEQTVKNHVTAVFEKLRVGNRTAAAMKARQLGLIPPIEADSESMEEDSAGPI